MSVDDWRDATVLDPVYLANLAASFIGIDLVGAMALGFSEITNWIDSYNHIGVAYISGNGDYAEWLEREIYPNPEIMSELDPMTLMRTKGSA